MAVRGGPDGDLWRLYFLDIFDILQLLEAVHIGKPETHYCKTVTRLVKTRVKDLPIIKGKGD